MTEKSLPNQQQIFDHSRDTYGILCDWYNQFVGEDKLPNWDELDAAQRSVQVEYHDVILKLINDRRVSLANNHDLNVAEYTEFRFLQNRYWLLVVADQSRNICTPMDFADPAHAKAILDMVSYQMGILETRTADAKVLTDTVNAVERIVLNMAGK